MKTLISLSVAAGWLMSLVLFLEKDYQRSTAFLAMAIFQLVLLLREDIGGC